MAQHSQSSPDDFETIVVLGVPFAKVTEAETIRVVESMIASRRPHYLATGNVDFLLQAWKDFELRRILHDADLVVCDSRPIVWISRVLGNPLPERVTGSDLTPALLKVAAEKDYSVFFLGGRPHIGEKAMENIRRDYPKLSKLHYYSPPNKPVLEMDHDDINRRLREANPDMLFVSFGCPKQEKWIAMNYRKAGVPMAVGVGATIDFLAGAVSRAPKWMQRCGLEWLYRMTREPKRLFKRYVMGILFFMIQIPRQILGMSTLAPSKERASETPNPNSGTTPAASHQAQPSKALESSKMDTASQWEELELPSRFDAAEAEANPLVVTDDTDHPVLLDGSRSTFIDSTGIGRLVQISKGLRRQNRAFVILDASKSLQRAIQLMNLSEFFIFAEDQNDATHRFVEYQNRQQQQLELADRSTQIKIRWQGEITAQTAEGLWSAIESNLPEDGTLADPLHVYVNMENVSFVDSTGIGLMVRLKKHIDGKGGETHFEALPPMVKNVLKHTNMTEYLIGKP